MTLLFYITRIITLPGAFLRGFLEHVTCKATGVLVENPACIRRDEACSHMEHELPRAKKKALLIALLPGTVNFLLGTVLLFSGLLPLTLLRIRPYESTVMFVFYIVLTYLGFSMLCNIFPLTEDAINARDLACGKQAQGTGGKILFTLPCAIAFAGSVIESKCITFLTTAAIIVLAFLFL